MLDFYNILWNRGKGGSPGPSPGPSPSPSPVDLNKPVKFIDYDGTVVESYTTSEFAALTVMPSNPSHTGLTAQGWNWSLEDAQTYVTEYGGLNIGQMYITESGDTEIYIELHEGRLSPDLGICPNGTVEIDWGDGSVKNTVTGTSTSTNVFTHHDYVNEGNYVIKLRIVSGTFGLLGASNETNLLSNSSSINGKKVYQNAIKIIHFGNGFSSLGQNALSNCYSLTSVTIPSGVTNIGNSAFNRCFSLVSITIPSNVTSISSNAFYYCTSLVNIMIPSSVTSINNNAVFSNCHSLASVTIPSSVTSITGDTFYSCYSLANIMIPSSVTSIDSSAFSYCSSLANIIIPSNVTNISNSAFNGCNGIKYLTFLPTTPPAVSNSNAFSSMASDLVVYVPQGTLETYQAATNYAKITNKMVEMP